MRGGTGRVRPWFSLAGGTPDSESFRHEAVAILHRAIGVDGWGWLLTDPGARCRSTFPVRTGSLTRPCAASSGCCRKPGMSQGGRERPAQQGFATSGPVTTLAALTGGDLRRDLSWREVWGPACR